MELIIKKANIIIFIMGGLFSAVTSLASTVVPVISSVASLASAGSSSNNSQPKASVTTTQPSGQNQSFNPTINISIAKRTTSKSNNINNWHILKEKLKSRERGDENDVIYRQMLKEENISEENLYNYIDVLDKGENPHNKYTEETISKYNNFIHKINEIFIKHY